MPLKKMSKHRCSDLRHPTAGTFPRASIIPVMLQPTRGIHLPCLRVHLDDAFLSKVPEPERLFWAIHYKKPQLFGIYEDLLRPWLVLPLDDALQEFASHSHLTGLWLLELESDLVKVVWPFASLGHRIQIQRRNQFIRDFIGTYLADLGIDPPAPPQATGPGEVVFPRAAGN